MAILTVAYRLGIYWVFGPASRLPASCFEFSFTLRVFLAARLLEFGLGLYVAYWIARQGAISTKASLIYGTVVLAGLIAAHIATPVDVFLPVRDGLYGISFAALLLLAAGSNARLCRIFFQNKALQWTGECSYSLYLLHMPMVSLITSLLARTTFSGPVRFGLSLFSVPAIVIGARAAYLAIEKPFLHVPKKIAVAEAVAKAESPGQLVPSALRGCVRRADSSDNSRHDTEDLPQRPHGRTMATD